MKNIQLFEGKLNPYTKYNKWNWDYNNGLPPLQKKTLTEDDEIHLEEGEYIYSTNVDGIPYVIVDTEVELQLKTKYVFVGQQGLYTLQLVDNNTKTLEFKMDKTLDLTERTLKKVQDYYDGWGIKKQAKHNYSHTELVETKLDVEGKLSKNQNIQIYSKIIKITDLVKNENGIIDIIGDRVEHQLLLPVYPYKENNEIKGWYLDIGKVLLKQVEEYNKNRGVINV